MRANRLRHFLPKIALLSDFHGKHKSSLIQVVRKRDAHVVLCLFGPSFSPHVPVSHVLHCVVRGHLVKWTACNSQSPICPLSDASTGSVINRIEPIPDFLLESPRSILVVPSITSPARLKSMPFRPGIWWIEGT